MIEYYCFLTRKKKMTKHAFTALFLLIFSFYAAASSVALRGYGSVKASFNEKYVSFQCENRNFAEIVYAKLIRDIKGCAAGDCGCRHPLNWWSR